jgi:NADH-quinone oxidoreductase subunit J
MIGPVSLLAAESFDLPANVAFAALAALMIYGAIRVVTTKNVMHAALWLVIVLLGMAANYILLQAEFVAITQVMVYIGAIIVLFLFGIMLTHNSMGETNEADNAKMRPVGIITGALLVALLSFSALSSFKDQEISFDGVRSQVEVIEGSTTAESGVRTESISDGIFSTYLLPFELVSVLLLGALIGAIVVARKE